MVQAKYKQWLTKGGLTKIRGWAQRGLVDEQIAHNIGINVATLYTWKKKYDEIDNALKKGKEIVDLEVENSLLNLATGKSTSVTKTSKIVNYEDDVLRVKRNQWINQHRTEEKYEEYSEEELQDEAILQVPTFEVIDVYQSEQQALPNATAIIFWLKNRRPDLWREKQFQEIQAQVNADVEATHKFDKMSDDDIRKLLRGEDDDGE